MTVQGYSWGIYLIQLLAFFAGWPVLSIIGLLAVRRRKLAATAQVIWSVLIVAVPIMGTVAFWLVAPGEKGDTPLDNQNAQR